MKHLLFSMSLFFCVISSAYGQEGVIFEELEWVDAVEKARAENKLIFLLAYVDWSQPCEMLDRFALRDTQVGALYNEQFINIRLDMEAFPGVELVEHYEIYGFPSMLFIDGNGKIIHRGCGVLNDEEMVQLAQQAMGEDNLSAYQNQFKAGDRSVELLTKYSILLEDACMSKAKLVEDYFNSVKSEAWTNEASWLMINLNVSDPYSEQFQYLINNKASFARKYGKDTVDQKIHSVLLDQFIAIYEEADITLFATQALREMISRVDFEQKEELKSMVDMKFADLKQNWGLFAESVVKVVRQQEVTDPEQLNEFAWKFYLFVNDQEKLLAAVEWMETVLKDYPEATYLDTYASLLYKTGNQKKAVKFAERALQAAGYELQDLVHYEVQLEKFKSGN